MAVPEGVYEREPCSDYDTRIERRHYSADSSSSTILSIIHAEYQRTESQYTETSAS